MSRKSLLLLSTISLVALAAWGFAPGKALPSCAEAAASAAGPCELQITVNPPIFNGSPAKPENAVASWAINNLPSCYRISATEVTFSFTLANGKTVSKTATPATGLTSVALSWPGPTGPLDPPVRPKELTTTVKVTAVPIDPQKIKSAVNSKTL
ncbi:MAG: hypothetical protein J2P41_09630 [Blastocatellia bacterium]|nr:hypothetical protein [Blastocatellia bacterium]